MATYPKTVFVNDETEVELKIARGTQKREYLFAQNQSLNDVFINQGTHADANNGTTIAAGLFYERERTVPQGTIYIKGSVAAPALQKVHVEEEFI